MARSKRRPKTKLLHIRLTPEDRKRIGSAAAAEFLDLSTWARKVILEAASHPECEEDVRAEETPPPAG